MNERTSSTEGKRYVNLREFAKYAGIGITNAKKAAVAIGAEKKIGKRCVYDINALDEHFAHADKILLPFQDEAERKEKVWQQ